MLRGEDEDDWVVVMMMIGGFWGRVVRGESSESFGIHHHHRLERVGAPEGLAFIPADVRALHDERTWLSLSQPPSATQKSQSRLSRAIWVSIKLKVEVAPSPIFPQWLHFIELGITLHMSEEAACDNI
ncbi:hypothetical protein CesoFtcFv8_003795 [Champsocephalus esox]|uniref:Uncharacterized protein n=1 Tax=Champsocephalus esox TaxID=159716 RepID=A0AAN8HC88_9TELE|nr:hypothetical protein CesoFtcFv8_003795 [Champsocephalus esox]